jgi:RHS repeat-associated protein
MQWLALLALLLVTSLAQAGTKHYYYTDPQGTPLAKADAQGNVVARYEYTPYGVPVTSVGAPPDGVGYTGHVNDSESGFVYMQARYYDAEVGRFLSVDPMRPTPGDGFSFNRYVYASNNSINIIDPNGMDGIPFGNCSKNPNCSVEYSSRGGGDGTQKMIGQDSFTSIAVLGQKVGIQYSNEITLPDRATASDALVAAATLINQKTSSLTVNEINSIKQITNVLVTGSKAKLGAYGMHTMALSIGYIKAVSAAWLASLFGHEGQHHLNGERYSGSSAWRDEYTARLTQLGIGRKVGFTRAETKYLESQTDPISNEKAMQMHMERGYEY